jgi:hypothetical protein
VGSALLASASASLAEPSTQMLANTCAVCHGTDGKSPGSIDKLYQMKTDEFACYSLLAPDYAISIAMMYELAGEEVRITEGAMGTCPRSASREYRAKEARDARGGHATSVADSFA